MKRILYLVRTESDFERAICLGIAGKKLKHEQYFVFVGDFSPYYEEGIKNTFQKYLFDMHEFSMCNITQYNILTRFISKIIGGRISAFAKVVKKPILIFPWLLSRVMTKHLDSNNVQIAQRMLRKINPDILFTDQSSEDSEYLPEIIRSEAHQRGCNVYIFPHGAAGGLHYHFSNPKYGKYTNYKVLASNTLEASQFPENRLVTGDFSSSFPYVHYLNSLDEDCIKFLEDRPIKIGFMIGGTIQSGTSTNAWSIQEEIIIELSERENIAMVLKLHPREASHMDLRMLMTFKNLLIVANETDRSRVSKWADIVVCNDHTSVIFEPMILGKKVVAISGLHTPKYRLTHSPLVNSSVTHISNSTQFNLANILSSEPLDKVTDAIAWGGHGKIDLAEMAMKFVE